MLDAIVDHPAPVIAAINGPAIGAGMQLAVACDIRVAALGARLAIPGGKLGVHLSPRNIWRLAQLVGQGAARDFLLAGRTVDAEEALRLGIVQYVEHDAVGAALALAGEIAASAPLTVQGHKRSLNLVAEAHGSTAGAPRSPRERGAFASDDLQEGMAAFAEKRTPRNASGALDGQNGSTSRSTLPPEHDDADSGPCRAAAAANATAALGSITCFGVPTRHASRR